MKPWETVRREVLGAWRSIRYDLDRRSGAEVETGTGAAPEARPAAGFDDPSVAASVNGPSGGGPSGGGETDGWYGRPLPERESVWAPLKDPRRMAAAGAVASVIAASATGTFFAVTGGLGILLADASAGAPAPATGPQVVATSTARHRKVAPSNRPSASTSARPSAAPGTRPADGAKPAPPATATTAPRSPIPETTPSTTTSHSTSPTAHPSTATSP
ncbi:MAG TPA: hypothetical protein VGP31_14255 [Planosporangium sp.]|nr:hypothetical protein [Planosporangium sp.]